MLDRQVWSSRPGFESSRNGFDQLRREMLRLLETPSGFAGDETRANVFPPLNITQDENSFYVRAEVPGVKASEFAISVVKNRVSIAGKREIPQERARDGGYHRRERAEGSFSRTVALPVDLDAERVEARYTDGILSLTLPKAEEAKPRQIAVRA